MMALQHQHGGVRLDNAEAGLRTACLTGVATARLSRTSAPDGNTVALTAGDIDEAVSGLLTNGLAAGDVNGEAVPAGSPSTPSGSACSATRTLLHALPLSRLRPLLRPPW